MFAIILSLELIVIVMNCVPCFRVHIYVIVTRKRLLHKLIKLWPLNLYQLVPCWGHLLSLSTGYHKGTDEGPKGVETERKK